MSRRNSARQWPQPCRLSRISDSATSRFLELFRMLTFEKLVQETAQKLAPNYPDITPALVRDVLTDTGIDESLHDSAPAAQGRLIVYSITIIGRKMHGEVALQPFRYTRKLGSGLWAWVGENGTGKSTILNCLLWALTGSDSGISKRIRPWIQDVHVEFSVGPLRFTSHVRRTTEGVTGGIFCGFWPPGAVR